MTQGLKISICSEENVIKSIAVVEKMQKRKDRWPTLRSVQFPNE